MASNETLVREFYFNKTGVRDAQIADGASLEFFFKGWSAEQDQSDSNAPVGVSVHLDGVIFHNDVHVLGVNVGMVQWGIQGGSERVRRIRKSKVSNANWNAVFARQGDFFRQVSKSRWFC